MGIPFSDRALFTCNPTLRCQRTKTNCADAQLCLFAFKARPKAFLLCCLIDPVVQVQQLKWTEDINCHNLPCVFHTSQDEPMAKSCAPVGTTFRYKGIFSREFTLYFVRAATRNFVCCRVK